MPRPSLRWPLEHCGLLSFFLVSTDVPAISKMALVLSLEFVLIPAASVPQCVEVVFCLDAGALG